MSRPFHPTPSNAHADSGCITRVKGIELGHCSHPQRPTGCSVVIAREGATAAVDVRGAAPGTRETDLLRPGNLVEKVHAVLLAGGSAWGLAATEGVVRWLEEQDIGLDTGYGKLPLVPAAVLFDLSVGDPRIRPGAACGYRACAAASRNPHPLAGNIGAGTGPDPESRRRRAEQPPGPPGGTRRRCCDRKPRPRLGPAAARNWLPRPPPCDTDGP